MKKALLAFLLVVLPLFQGQALAATFADKNLAQLVAEAEQIFVGTVSSLQSRKLAGGAIVTDVGFTDVQMAKGSNQGDSLVLLVLGGEVDGVRLEIPGMPQFQRGTRYLVFSSGNGKDMFPVVGGPVGLFQIVAGPMPGSPIALTSSGAPLPRAIEADVLSAATLARQAAAQPPVTLALFLAAIKAKLALQ